MADTKLSALTEATAVTDADELYVNDGGTSKRITAANGSEYLSVPNITTYDDSRMGNANELFWVGPWTSLTTGNTGTTTVGPGCLILGYVMSRGGTPSSIDINIVTGSGTSGDEAHMVMYAAGDDGLPTGSPVYDWGPFDIQTSGSKNITGQTQTVAKGWYWCGAFCPTANTGNLVATGLSPSVRPAVGNASQVDRSVFLTADTSSATAPDVSAYTFSRSGGGATVFNANTGFLPTMVTAGGPV